MVEIVRETPRRLRLCSLILIVPRCGNAPVWDVGWDWPRIDVMETGLFRLVTKRQFATDVFRRRNCIGKHYCDPSGNSFPPNCTPESEAPPTLERLRAAGMSSESPASSSPLSVATASPQRLNLRFLEVSLGPELPAEFSVAEAGLASESLAATSLLFGAGLASESLASSSAASLFLEAGLASKSLAQETSKYLANFIFDLACFGICSQD